MIPENLLQAADIQDKALFAGQGEYFTIWNPAKFEGQVEQDKPFFDKDLEELSAAWPTAGGSFDGK